MTHVINAVEDFGMNVSAEPAVNKAALLEAIAWLGDSGGEIMIPKGLYTIDAGIVLTQKNITITGAGSALGYEGVEAGTELRFNPSEDYAFHLVGDYSCLRNMHLNGYNNTKYGIKVEGGHLLDHLHVAGFRNAGIWLYKLVNQTHLSFVSSCYNTRQETTDTGYGLLIGNSEPDGYSNNTILSIDSCTFYRNRVGVRIQNAVALSFTNTVIESNYEEGMQIYRPKPQVTNVGESPINLNHLSFDSCHWESNDIEGSVVQLSVGAGDQNDPASYLTFRNCMFHGDTGSTPARGTMEINAVKTANFTNCGGDCEVRLEKHATSVGFYNCEGLTIEDGGKCNWTGSNASGETDVGGPKLSGLTVDQLNVNQIHTLGTGTVTVCKTDVTMKVYTIARSDQVRYYHVYAKIKGGTADVENYSAYALIAADSTSRIMQLVNGGRLKISLAQLEIEVVQESGAAAEVEVLVTPVFPIIG